LKSRANLEYQSCLKFHILHAWKILALLQFWAERYGIFSDPRPTVQQPWQQSVFEFSGMIALTLSLSWIPILEGMRFYIPCLKMMIFMWWKNAPHMFLKFLSTDEHNQCKIHLSPSSLRMVSNRSILISLPSQVKPCCTLMIAYTPFLQFRSDPPNSYGYVKVITPLSLRRYPYINLYKFSAHNLKIIMLSHKQINENMVTRH
jgi:hypothetical protein